MLPLFEDQQCVTLFDREAARHAHRVREAALYRRFDVLGRMAPVPLRLIRFPTVRERTGLSRSTVWRLERQGAFPKHRRISPNAVGWLDTYPAPASAAATRDRIPEPVPISATTSLDLTLYSIARQNPSVRTPSFGNWRWPSNARFCRNGAITRKSLMVSI
jgi:predicted DNA-binding transcriptional regulator AlpA